MVVIGGITRLTGSGLSITEWKIVTGTIPPLSEESWQQEFDAYQQTPQFRLLNSDFQLSDFKKIYFWEYLHRLIGRFIGIAFLIPFFWFLLKKKFPGGYVNKMLILLLLGALQGVIGWLMVLSGLTKNNIAVSHYRLAIHLISAFTLFGFTFWYTLQLIPRNYRFNAKIHTLAKILFIIVIIQIIYGAFVAGLQAGNAYPTWPKMGDRWIPDDLTALEPVWKNFFEGRTGVQFVHRYLAFAVVLFTGIILFNTKDLHPGQKRIIYTLCLIVLVQFTLGVITLLYGVPITIAVLHQTGAFFLFATSLLLVYRTK